YGQAVESVIVRLPLNDKVFRDVDFPVNIPHDNFFDCIFAIMAVDRATAELGWKSNNEPNFGPVHRLATDNSDDLDGAFRTLLRKMNQTRRQEDVIMEIKHLNPTPIEAQRRGSNNNWAADSVYRAELRLIQEKLSCGVHAGPNRWCYMTSEKPDEHIALGYEEICLWARSIHDNDSDPDCLLPPRCLRLPGVSPTAGHVRANTISKPSIPPIHVNINNAPLLPKANINQTAPGPSARNLKRTHSVVSTEESSDSDGDSDEEALRLSDVIHRLHRKFPLLNFPQYMPLLKQEGIIYAETVANFSEDFYTDLGLTEGAVGQFLSSVKRILGSEKREKKRVRAYSRQYSVEI
ncbi:hypothetical protein HYPSUDRAFT_152273, partial [Hypholoma sublateritium FD-334 SS-4]